MNSLSIFIGQHLSHGSRVWMTPSMTVKHSVPTALVVAVRLKTDCTRVNSYFYDHSD